MRWLLILFGLSIATCSRPPEPGPTTRPGPQPPVSGYAFLTPETQALQDDAFANPGYLWVDQGERLFEAVADGAPACASCHDDRLAGVAAHYPAVDEATGRLMNLEARINACRERHQGLEPLDYESEALLSLTAFIAHQSKGITVSPRLYARASSGG